MVTAPRTVHDERISKKTSNENQSDAASQCGTVWPIPFLLFEWPILIFDKKFYYKISCDIWIFQVLMRWIKLAINLPRVNNYLGSATVRNGHKSETTFGLHPFLSGCQITPLSFSFIPVFPFVTFPPSTIHFAFDFPFRILTAHLFQLFQVFLVYNLICLLRKAWNFE